jgi:uncharacterized protein (TIGR03435 family)
VKRRSLLILALHAWAAAGADPPRFEAAAIHPHDPNLRFTAMRIRGGELSIYGMTIRNLIWLAWKLPPERVVGGPKWLDSDRYDIQAKAPVGSRGGESEQWGRVQTLLADRMRLRVHRETKNESVYFLQVAKGGLRMEPDSSRSRTGSILPWSMIVRELSGIVGRPVIDQTGLTGAWHVALRYTSEDGKPASRGVPVIESDPGPSIFTAVQEQLGLRLDAGKGPVERLVIDSVERPSAN